MDKKDLVNVPYITLRRIDCQEQKSKTGEAYYMFSGLYTGTSRTDLVTFYTKDKDLYSSVLAIPINKEFKLYYDLIYNTEKGFRLFPICVSL